MNFESKSSLKLILKKKMQISTLTSLIGKVNLQYQTHDSDPDQNVRSVTVTYYTV